MQEPRSSPRPRSHDPAIGRIGGAWKVAYADLATAMMAFFLVLWLVDQDRAVRVAVARYFQDPIGFERGSEGGRSPLGGIGGGDAPIEGLLESARPSPRDVLERAARRLRKTLETTPGFEALGRRVALDVSGDGLRIELVEEDATSFFERGGAELSREGRALVGAIGRELAGLGNDVILEGHTDAVPFRGPDGAAYGNWELSTDRAHDARRALEAGGLPADRVRAVRGYADQRLRLPDAPADPRNRRIAIVVPTATAPPRRATPE
ncbi:Motility protein B [Gammaproteobacteria bacterium]|nr:Motility protein B [Gammaproteobacteria bacterium]